MPNAQRASIATIAAHAGVSVSTAARVFNAEWDGKVKASNRERVLQAAKELGYYGTNAFAKGLRSKETNIIALITPETMGRFYSLATSKLVQAFTKIGKQVMVFPVDPSQQSLDKVVADVHQYCVDGVVVTSPATLNIVESFESSDLPCVLFNRLAIDSGVSSVYCDNVNVGRTAASCFLERGLTRLAFITGNTGPTLLEERLQGFISCTEANNGVITHVRHSDYTYENTVAIARAILSDNRPQGIYCSEDSMACAVIDVARNEFGLTIPRDLSIIGNDDTTVSRYINYNLTTFHQPLEDMVRSTVEIMEKLLISNAKQYERVFDMRLIARGTVREKKKL